MSQPGILCHLLQRTLEKHFSSDTQQMALAIGCTVDDLAIALTTEGYRRSADIFEKLSVYCAGNNISLDVMLSEFQTE